MNYYYYITNLFLFNIFLLKLYDPFQGLTQRNWSVTKIVEINLMRQIGSCIEKSVEFPFHLGKFKVHMSYTTVKNI